MQVKCSFIRSAFNVAELSMNQRIGYARVSTDDQNLDLQRDALQQAGCSTIYEEAASGKSTARPELEQCRKALRAGDTLVVWRLDRLGRSLPDLVQIVADLEQRGVHFESLTEKIETGNAAGKLQFHVFAALAEFERGLIRERTRAGLKQPVPVAGPVAASRSWTPSRYATSRRYCATRKHVWQNSHEITACLEQRFTSIAAWCSRAPNERTKQHAKSKIRRAVWRGENPASRTAYPARFDAF
jgi:hypothetical protein